MGYLNEKRADRKGYVYIDPERGHIIKKMFEKVAYEKWSGKKIYHWLKFDLNFKTPNGNKGLTLSNIYLLLQNDFYYGSFEYPRKSGLWYKGVHEPLITKELFDLVQEQIRGQIIRVHDKEFAFTKIMECGLCGSGICADEKFKKQKNGNIHRYVYYGCTKSKDKHCKCGYINESELIEQFVVLMEQIDIDEIGIKEKIKSEVERFKKFQHTVLGIKTKVQVVDVDIRNYAKYLLKEGSTEERRELLGCLRGRVTLKNKVVVLER